MAISRTSFLVAVVLLMFATVLGACGSSGPGPSAAAQSAAAGPAAGGCAAGATRPRGGPDAAQYGGVERSYLISLPAAADGRVPVPLVVDLHGFAGGKESQEAATEMGRKATARGYAVVTPDALGNPRQWNIFNAVDQPDDFGFLRALVADLTRNLCVDPHRIYVAGHSNGSAFAAFLGCRTPYLFAAVAMVSATTPSTCPAGSGPSTIAIHGTADQLVPYSGGTVVNSPIQLPPAPEVTAASAKLQGCGPDPDRDEPFPGVARVHYTGCAGGSDLVLDTVDGGRHAWPGGSAARTDPANSTAGKNFDATSAILDFFDAHRLPAQTAPPSEASPTQVPPAQVPPAQAPPAQTPPT